MTIYLKGIKVHLRSPELQFGKIDCYSSSRETK